MKWKGKEMEKFWFLFSLFSLHGHGGGKWQKLCAVKGALPAKSQK
jgi:hypothetical protein